jgi:hypothetical protein
VVEVDSTVVAVVLIGVFVAAIATGVIVAVKSNRARDAAGAHAAEADASRSQIAPATPMTGLESALDQVMDRSGTKMRQKLEAEAPVVDELRQPDDTGPLLRRALDRVEHHDEPGPDDDPGDPSPR